MLKILCALLLLPITIILIIIGVLALLGASTMLFFGEWVVGIVVVVALICFIVKKIR